MTPVRPGEALDDPTSASAVARASVSWPIRPPIAESERPRLEELGTTLRAAREAAGLTLEDLGPIVGSPESLRAIEGGQVRTRASRLRPWLARVGVAPEPVIEQFADVIAPERQDGKTIWKPWTPPAKVPRETPPPDLPPLPEYAQRALGAELWRMRVTADRSRPALAGTLNVSRIHIWMVEHGARRPSVELVNAWLEATGTDVDRLLLAVRFPGRIAPASRRHPSGGAPRSTRSSANGRFTAASPPSETQPSETQP